MLNRQQFNNDFDEFVASMRNIMISKNHDYTSASADPLFNFKRSENMGIPAWKGAMIRFSDKVSRLETFAQKEMYEVADENFVDTLRDAANYLFLIGELYKESKNAKNNKADEGDDRSTVIVKQQD